MRTTSRECYGCREPFRNVGDTLTILSSYQEDDSCRYGQPVSWCEKCTARLDRALDDHWVENTDARSRGQEMRHR
jgi:hypothetical protein